MIMNLTKSTWTFFSENLGTTFIHPQFTIIKYQNEAIFEAKRYAKGKLIDIGCGRMPYRKILEPLVDSYTGVDHPEASKLYKSDYKIDVLADAKKLPFENKTFDTALLIQVLEHVDSPDRVIKEAARILKPNGTLIISVPFFYPLHDMPYDWGRYTSSALKSLVEQADLKIIKLTTQGSFFEFWLQMLNTFLAKRINDILLHLNLYSFSLLVLMVVFSVPIILINNILILVASSLFKILPRFPDYFPLEYLVIAKKRS